MSGRVVSAGVFGGYGNQVLLQHADGSQTRYGHLSQIGVGVGQSVAAGERIGAVGNTGVSTGSHLHFEVIVGGTPVDPAVWLRNRGLLRHRSLLRRRARSVDRRAARCRSRTETHVRVTVLGTGTMGAGVAGSLLREGHEVTVWNRTADKAAPLAERGATVATDPAAAVADAEVVLLTLFDTDAVLDVLETAAGDAPTDAVWVQASTIGVAGTETVVQLAGKYGITLVEAMMLGTKAPAEQGKLTMLAAGPADVLDRIDPVLDAIGAKTVRAGDEVGAGTALKLAANAWIASITAATGQSLAVARSLGLDPSLFLEAIAGGASDSAYAHTKGKSMIAGEFPAQFALDGLRKDIGLITDAARTSGVSTVLLDALGRVYADASAAGHGGDDIAAVGTAFDPR